MSASEIAERFANLSAYIYRAYCTGFIVPDLPVSATMAHLRRDVYSYAFSLVVEGHPGLHSRPGQDTTLNTPRALESMGQIAGFLEAKAADLEACGRHNEIELALAKDLRFAEKYTDMLLHMGPDSFVAGESSMVPDEIVAEIPEPQPMGEEVSPVDTTTDVPNLNTVSEKKIEVAESPAEEEHAEMSRDVWLARVDAQRRSHGLLPVQSQSTGLALESQPTSEEVLPNVVTTEAPQPKPVSEQAQSQSRAQSPTDSQHSDLPRDAWLARVDAQRVSHGLLPVHPKITAQTLESQPMSEEAPEPKPMSEKARGKMRAVELPDGVHAALPDYVANLVRDLPNGDHGEFKCTVAEPVTAHLNTTQRAVTQQEDQHAGPSHAEVDAQTYLNLPAQANSAVSSGATTSAGATTPHDLRPTPYNAEHAPHPLQGSRLSSRSGVDDNDAFAKLHTPLDKLLHEVPDVHTTVQIGHSTSDNLQPCQYVDASTFGFDGIKAIKLVHPFCAQEIRELDFDVLRHIEIVLHQKAVGYASHGDDRVRTAKRAQKKSQLLVRREIGIRDWDIKRARQQAARQTLAEQEARRTSPEHDAEEVGSRHSWPGHEERAAAALKKSMETASVSTTHISESDSSVVPEDAISQRLPPAGPRRERPDIWSIDVRVPKGAKGPKDVHVIWADDTSPDVLTSRRTPPAQTARQDRSPSHRSVATELLRALPGGPPARRVQPAHEASTHPSQSGESVATLPSDIVRAPGRTKSWVTQVDEATAAAAGPDAVKVANGSYNGGQMAPLGLEIQTAPVPVLELRDHGPSMVQLQAQLTMLQDQIARSQPRTDMPGSWPNTPRSPLQGSTSGMPRSPLQGSPSDMEGTHDGCDCEIIPCVQSASKKELQADVAVITTAEAGPATEEPATGEPATWDTVRHHRLNTSDIGPEPVITTPTIVQPVPRHVQAQDELLKWSEELSLFEGRSSPPFVAYTNAVDGKKYVLDTDDGKPMALDSKPTPYDGKSILKLPELDTSDGKPMALDGKPIPFEGTSTAKVPQTAEVDNVSPLQTPCYSPICGQDNLILLPGACYALSCHRRKERYLHITNGNEQDDNASFRVQVVVEPTQPSLYPRPKGKQRADGNTEPLIYTNYDGKRYILYTPNGSPQLVPNGEALPTELEDLPTMPPDEDDALAPSLPHERLLPEITPAPSPPTRPLALQPVVDTLAPLLPRERREAPPTRQPELLDAENHEPAPLLPHERLGFPFLTQHTQRMELRSSRGRQQVGGGKQRLGHHGIRGLIERPHEWDDYGYSEEDRMKPSQLRGKEAKRSDEEGKMFDEAGCSARDRVNFEKKKE